MTPNLNLNSDAKILQIFGYPFLQIQNMKTSRGPTPKCYTFLETSHDPLSLALNPLHTLPLSLLPLPIYLGCDFIDTSLVKICFD